MASLWGCQQEATQPLEILTFQSIGSVLLFALVRAFRLAQTGLGDTIPHMARNRWADLLDKGTTLCKQGIIGTPRVGIASKTLTMRGTYDQVSC